MISMTYALNDGCTGCNTSKIDFGRHTGYHVLNNVAFFYSMAGSDSAGVMKDVQYYNLEKLLWISNLEDGWDGYDAIKIDANAISNTKLLLSSLKIQPALFPTCRGSIQIEYEKPDLDYLEFEICGDMVRAMRVHPSGRIEKKNLAFDENAKLFVITKVGEFHDEA